MSLNKQSLDLLGESSSGRSSKRIKLNPPTIRTNTVPPTINDSAPREETHRISHKMVSTLKGSMKFLQKSCRLLPPLESAVGTLLEVLECVEGINQGGEELRDVSSDLTSWTTVLSAYISDCQPEQMSEQVKRLTEDLVEQAECIKATQQLECGAKRRLIDSGQQLETLTRSYHLIETSFHQLQMDADLSTWKIADDTLKAWRWLLDLRLNTLKPAHDARYNSSFSDKTERGGCYCNTRVLVLGGIHAWIHNPNKARIYWINGMAGTGKTTIAYSVCDDLKRDGRLGACFFCSRASPECRDVGRILPTIAYQLARQFYPFRSSLCRILGQEPDIGQCNISMQFEYLIQTPLLEVQELLPTGLVIIIDALDECSDPRTVEAVLNILFRQAIHLPVSFFLTSRPEPPVVNAILAQNSSSHSILHLHNVEENLVKADIVTYLTVKLAKLSLSGDQISQLADRAGILFIYAATVARYLTTAGRGTNISARLAAVLNKSQNQGNKLNQEIDQLYKTILDGVFGSEELEQTEAQLIKRVIWTVVCAREPLTKDALAALLSVSNEEIETALQPLQSVLHVSEGSEVVSTFHASFPEFMLSLERSGPLLHCDEQVQNTCLSSRCFELMKEQLKFNICGLETSYRFDKDVQDLADKVGVAISTELAYACRYWSEHVHQSPTNDKLMTCLDEFLDLRLLFWIEVLNLKGWIGNGAMMLTEALAWLPSTEGTSETRNFLHDARNFVIAFAVNPIRQSTPHIYISALPLVPRHSKVWKSYWSRTRGLLRLEGTLVCQREGDALAIWETGYEITTIAYSPDGTKIVLGSKPGVVQVWDTFTGNPYSRPLFAHNSTVSSVAFSPDGTRIVSGSWDRTIQVWDVQTSTPFGEQLEGHTKAVWSVAFSPDGARIVSGSTDRTIRIWATDGTLVGGPLRGHTGTVRSVAFSPDGAYIVSGSEDCTIRFWEGASGKSRGSPLKGHTNAISSVAFSPDGNHVVSSSRDRTVRVWDAHRTNALQSVLEGHTDVVTCATFSSDGTRIVSSSADRTIRVWDARRNTLIGAPMRGHRNTVISVAFSPNSTCIASGSQDSTIRVWDVHNNAPCEPVDAHTDVVTCVRFLSGKAQIMTRSDDGMTRVWHAESGALLDSSTTTPDEIPPVAEPEGIHICKNPIDFRIQVWGEVQGFGVNTTLVGHADEITSIAVSSSRKRVVSSSKDYTIRVWDLFPGDRSRGSAFPAVTRGALGWLVCPITSEPVFWLPGELRNIFPSGTNPLIISPSGSIKIGPGKIFMGDSWVQCYESSTT